MTSLHLLLIDPQNDFCDLPAPAQPALPVTGADADLRRIATLIRQAAGALTDITLTLDSHHPLHIAHPPFWQQGAQAAEPGGPAQAFTTITAASVRAQQWAPRDPNALPRVLAYLDTLEASGRYTLTLWPVHCVLGQWGHEVHAEVLDALNAWETTTGRRAAQVRKGSHLWTEHYSALQAEVPDPQVPETQLNTALIERLQAADHLFIAGEAGSHCVKSTTEHLVEHLAPLARRRVSLLVDAMSPVRGYEAQQADFLAGMKAAGLQLSTTAEVLRTHLAPSHR